MSSAVFYSSKFSSGHLVSGIPEGPDRAEHIIKKLHNERLLERARLVEPKPCGLEILSLNHSRQYIDDFRSSCAQHRQSISHQQRSEDQVWYDQVALKNLLGNDEAVANVSRSQIFDFRKRVSASEACNTPITSDSYDLALLSAGSVVDACDLIMSGEFRNAFCIVRPPGHHAEYDTARGFCFFNNVAIGARHLLANHGLERIMIIDVDVHHGNGAQHSFYDDSKVLVCNVHRNPQNFYPYNCGFADELGSGAGEGFNLNIPLAAGSGPNEYNKAISEIERRAIEFNPQFILVSMGFDAHKTDSMGGMNLSTGYFSYLSERLVKIAQQSEGRFISVLEGGYVRKSLADCAAAHLKELMRT